jgi:NADH:ubiquinone oxidoreductase subunit 6 (subunit J)
MTLLATSLINWSALWKIVLAALVGGGGVVIVFGFLLLGLQRARAAKSSSARVADWALTGVCGLFCIAAVVIGIYAMATKPKSKPAKPAKAASTQVSAPRLRQRAPLQRRGRDGADRLRSVRPWPYRDQLDLGLPT